MNSKEIYEVIEKKYDEIKKIILKEICKKCFFRGQCWACNLNSFSHRLYVQQKDILFDIKTSKGYIYKQIIEEYENKMKEIDELIDLDPEPNSNEGKRLIKLVSEVERYEKDKNISKQIKNVFNRIKRKSREKRLRELGFEDQNNEQRKEQLAKNIALLDWPKE